MLTLLRRTYFLVVRGGRLKWLALAALAVIVSALEAVGAGLVFVLLRLVTEGDLRLTVPVLGEIGVGEGTPDERLTMLVATAIAVFFVLRAGMLMGQRYAQERVAYNAGAQLATRLVRGYLRMPYAFYLRRNSAELTRNAFESVQVVISQVVVPAVRFVAELLLVAALLAVLIFAAPLPTLVAACVLGPAVYVLLRVIQPRLKRLGRDAQQAAQEGYQTLQQGVHGIRDLRLLGRERYFERAYARSRASYARSQYLRGFTAEMPRALIETTLVLFIVAFFLVSLALGRTGQETLSLLGLFAYAGLRMQPSLQKIVSALNSLRYASAAIDNVYEDLLTAEQFADQAQPLRHIAHIGFENQLELREVEFQYEGTVRPALQSVNLTIGKGEALGICGATGGGKSTLVDVIAGLLPPTQGVVLVDGRDIHENIRSWHARLGVVSQSVFLLDDTLRRNIALGLNDREIDGDAVTEAIRLAQLEEFVTTLPEGLDTVVGERGVRVSGGQRQRVAIARALYHRPAVLIFDEGTSALDNKTEAELVAALESLRGRWTLIMVAHRLTTVRHCDRIVVVEEGQIADAGTYDELVGRHALFGAL